MTISKEIRRLDVTAYLEEKGSLDYISGIYPSKLFSNHIIINPISIKASKFFAFRSHRTTILRNFF